MKELLKHLPAIKKFVEERTQAFQELSDNTVKNFLREAYKLPFLFPVRIIVSEEKFVNFLFDMRKDLFDGKNIFFTSENNEHSTESTKSEEVAVKSKKNQSVEKKKVKKTSSNTVKQEKSTNQEIVSENSKKEKKVTPKNTTKTSTSTIKTNTQRTTAQTKKVKA